jgi:hypothetical protein
MICWVYKKEMGVWGLEAGTHPSILCLKIRMRNIVNDNPPD